MPAPVVQLAAMGEEEVSRHGGTLDPVIQVSAYQAQGQQLARPFLSRPSVQQDAVVSPGAKLEPDDVSGNDMICDVIFFLFFYNHLNQRLDFLVLNVN